MPSESGYTPIICLSASRWVGITGQQDSIPSVTRVGRRNVGFDYIPGAGDDDELWAKVSLESHALSLMPSVTDNQGLTPSTFWEKRESLLKMERDALERGLDEAVASAALATKMAKLDVQGGSSSAVDSEPWADLVGVPNPTSHLALALEPPVVPVKPWQTPPPEDLITIYVVEITKGQSYPDIIYPVPTSKDTKPTSLVLAIPSPKTDSWGYKTCLVRLIADLRGIVSDVIRIVIKGGSTANLDAVIADKAASDQKASVQDRLDALPTPTDVPTRKVILPIALLLLCSFPRLHPPPPQRLEGEDEDETDKEDEEEVIMTKSQISSVLLSLVALWPDGNPPRAALKRVNEVLMSKS
jgi:tRNA A64-2'-O-ribosylphosphate transferase